MRALRQRQASLTATPAGASDRGAPAAILSPHAFQRGRHGLSRPGRGPRARSRALPSVHRPASCPGPVPPLRQTAARARAQPLRAVCREASHLRPRQRRQAPGAAGRKSRRDPEKARACERRRYRRKTAERISRPGSAPPAARPRRSPSVGCARNAPRRSAQVIAGATPRLRRPASLYGGKSAELRRRNGHARSKQRYHARRERGPVRPLRRAPARRRQTLRGRNAASHATSTSAPGGMPGARRGCADRAAIPRRTARLAARAAPCCAPRRCDPHRPFLPSGRPACRNGRPCDPRGRRLSGGHRGSRQAGVGEGLGEGEQGRGRERSRSRSSTIVINSDTQGDEPWLSD